MARTEKDYVLIKVKVHSKKGKKKDFVYYYRLKGEPRGKRHSTGFDIEHKARAFVESIIAENNAEQEAIKKHKNNKARITFPTFYDFAKDFFDKENCLYLQWLKDYKNGRLLSPLYISNQRRLVKNYILKSGFLHNEWDNIQGIDILDFITQLQLPEDKSVRNEEKLYGFGVNADKAFRIKKLLTLIFNRAVFVGIIDKSPIKADTGNIKTEKNHRERDIFSVEEIRYIFSQERHFDSLMWKTFFTVLATTGIRMGEIRALRWDNILFNDNAITITNAFKTRKNDITEENFALPKWNKTRTVIMPKITKYILEEWKNETEFIKKPDFVFCYEDGTPLKYDTCLSKFKKMIKRTQLEEIDKTDFKEGRISRLRVFEPHCFRHSFNTHLLNSNVSDNIVQKVVGHESNSMTQNYLHIDKNLLEDLSNSNQFDVYFKDTIKGKDPERADEIKLAQHTLHQFFNFSRSFDQILIKNNDTETLSEFSKYRTRIEKMVEKYL